jgi:hypothetical protein
MASEDGEKCAQLGYAQRTQGEFRESQSKKLVMDWYESPEPDLSKKDVSLILGKYLKNLVEA